MPHVSQGPVKWPDNEVRLDETKVSPLFSRSVPISDLTPEEQKQVCDRNILALKRRVAGTFLSVDPTFSNITDAEKEKQTTEEYEDKHTHP
jgi:hypothetical protein